MNLVSNAMKYAIGSPIEITLSRISDNRLLLMVKDYGPGIPADKLNSIFDRFVRATSSRHINGLGLGLYITKQIVESHQGTIRVESELGHGACFIVELPLKPC